MVKIYNNSTKIVFEQATSIRDYAVSDIRYRIVDGVASFYIKENQVVCEQFSRADIENKTGGTYATDLLLSEYLSFFLTESDEVNIVGSLPLPTGAATAAKQDTGNDYINSIRSLSVFEIQKGLVSGVSIVNKSGRNPNITSASAPEDMWNGSTVYSGFPTGSPETLAFFSSNAGDTGVLTYIYLATSASTSWQTATVTLNGTTPVTGVSAYRVHSASYNSGGATSFNLGTITCRHQTTTANIFFNMPIGTSQTYVSAYTVPSGCTAFVKRVFCQINTQNTVAMQGALWIRANGASPRLRRNFNVNNTSEHNDEDIYLKLPALTDVTLRLTSSTSASSQVVIGGFDIVLINSVL